MVCPKIGEDWEAPEFHEEYDWPTSSSHPWLVLLHWLDQQEAREQGVYGECNPRRSTSWPDRKMRKQRWKMLSICTNWKKPRLLWFILLKKLSSFLHWSPSAGVSQMIAGWLCYAVQFLCLGLSAERFIIHRPAWLGWGSGWTKRRRHLCKYLG